MCVPLKFLHLAQSVMTLTIDWSGHGMCILSRSAILTRSWWKCQLLSCSVFASSTASSFVMHLHHATALVHIPPPMNHNFPSSIIYCAAWCHALFLSLSPILL